jgi:hypothetical protein
VFSGYVHATRPLSAGAAECVLPSTPMSRAGVTAAAPIVKRRVRVERFLIVGRRYAAKRSNMVRLPFFLAGASARITDRSAAGEQRPAWLAGYGGLPGTSGPAARRRATGSTVLGDPSDHHTCGPTGRSHDGPQDPRLAWMARDGEHGRAWLTLV